MGQFKDRGFMAFLEESKGLNKKMMDKIKVFVDEIAPDKRFTISEDSIDILNEIKNFEFITEFKGEDWSKGDDYTVAILGDKDLYLVYVDYHSLELSIHDNDDYIDSGFVTDSDKEYLIDYTKVTKRQVSRFFK